MECQDGVNLRTEVLIYHRSTSATHERWQDLSLACERLALLRGRQCPGIKSHSKETLKEGLGDSRKVDQK